MNTIIKKVKVQIIGKACLYVCLLMCCNIATQAGNLENIQKGFANANAKMVAVNFATNVDVTFSNQQIAENNVQASVFLTSFFIKNSTKTFTISYRGTDASLNEYAICNLETTLNSYIVFINLNSAKKITALKFERQ